MPNIKATNILMLAPFVPSIGYNAAADNVTQMIRHLHARGHKIRLLAVAAHEGEASSPVDVREFVEELLIIPNEQNRGAGDPLYMLPVNFRWPYVCDWIERQMAWADIVDAEFVEMAHLVPGKRQIPLLVVNHEAQTATWFDYARSANLFSRDKVLNLYRAVRALEMERKVLRQADCMLAYSREDAAALRKLSIGAKIGALHASIDLERYKMLSAPPGKHQLAYIGYYGHRPNQDAARMLVKEVLPLVHQKFPDARLVLAGSYPTDEIKSYSSENVVVTGRIPDLTPVFQESDVMVFPIVSGRGVRMKVLQTMALGRPIVTTTLGTYGLVVQGDRHVRLADSPEAFAKQICELFSYPEQARQLTENARNYIENHDFKSVVTQFETCMADLIVSWRGKR